MSPYVVNVVGIPGSGKSYICRKLNHIKCIDTDRVLDDTYNELIKTNAKFRKTLTIANKKDPEMLPDALAKILFSEAKKRLQNKLNNLTEKFVIVVGITVKCKANDIFFIAIKEAELAKIYRRVMQREADKISKNYSKVCKIIKNAPIDQVATKLHFNLEIGAMDICTTFAGYKQIYKEAIQGEKKRKAHILPQGDIIKKIQALYKQNA